MTKEEIKALVAEKIAGQGSAIDAASVLPAILNGIIDAIPDEPIPLPINAVTFENKTLSEASELLGLTEEQFNSLPEQTLVRDSNGNILTRTFVHKLSQTDWVVGFGASIGDDYGAAQVIMMVSPNEVHSIFYEV